MEFGTSIPQHLIYKETGAGRPETIAGLIKEIEDAGFTYVSVGDHIVHPGVSHREHEDPATVYYGDVFSVLTFYGIHSKKLRLLTGVLILPYRQPFQVAHAVATVDQLTGGRVMLGVGPGYAIVEFEAFGLPVRERGPMTDEYLDIITRLLSERDVTFDGAYYQFHNISLLFPPVQKPRPPIWIGGSGKRALNRAIHRGDVWAPIATGVPVAGKRRIRVAVTPRELEEDVKRASAARKELGKPPLGIYLSASTAMLFRQRPHRADVSTDPRDRYVSGTGTAGHLVEELLAYAEAGAKGVSLGLTGRTLDECRRDVEVAATQVMAKVG